VPEGDERTISNLLLDQIEFADVILLNKTDLLTQQDYSTADSAAAAAAGKGKGKQKNRTASSSGGHAVVQKLVGMLQQLNPLAKVVPTSRCAVELEEVLLTGRFDMEQVSSLWRSYGAGDVSSRVTRVCSEVGGGAADWAL
jgi:G3E family GTPase